MLITAWPLLPNIQAGPGKFGQFMTGPQQIDPEDPYWRARIADGSVCLHDPKPAVRFDDDGSLHVTVAEGATVTITDAKE